MSKQKVQVDGRTAFVSGAASGMGRAVALRLAAHGCPVAIVDQNEDGLRETAELIAGPVLARTLDVRDRQAQMAFAAEVADWAPTPAGHGPQQRRSRHLAERRRGIAGGRRVGPGHQPRRRDQRHPRLPTDPPAPGLRGDRQHLERVRARRHPVSERVLHLEVRGPRLHRVAAPRAARHRRAAPSPSTPAASRPTSPATPASTRIRRVPTSPTRRRPSSSMPMAFTTPERAAKTIHEGVKAGRSRSSSAPTPTCSTRWRAWRRRATSTSWRFWTGWRRAAADAAARARRAVRRP